MKVRGVVRPGLEKPIWKILQAEFREAFIPHSFLPLQTGSHSLLQAPWAFLSTCRNGAFCLFVSCLPHPQDCELASESSARPLAHSLPGCPAALGAGGTAKRGTRQSLMYGWCETQC